MLCALLLLPGFLGAAAVASPDSGPHECAKGSEVWCQDLQAASRCGAVGHCQRAVWGKPTASSLPCSVCQDVAASAANGLNPEATESDILALLTKICEWLPSQESSARCKEMVDAHSPSVLSMLASAPGSGPAQVCTALTLCEPLQRHLAAPGEALSPEDVSEATAPFMANGPLSFHPPQTPGAAVCRDCAQLIAKLQAALRSNPTLPEASVQEQCLSLEPGLADLCRSYVRQFLIPAESTLRLLPPQEVCHKGGFCEEQGSPAHRPAQVAAVDGVPSLELGAPQKQSEIQMRSGLTCEVCMDVVQRLDEWLGSNGTEAKISHALERVCSIMPATLVQQCITLVDSYSPALVQILTRVPPDEVCTTIRLCGSRRRARSLHRVHATTPPLLLDEESQGSFCYACQRLLGVSSQNLERQSTKRDILMAFKSGCRILPLPYAVQCRRFVAEYEPVLIESFQFMMEPAALCRKMGACHASRTPLNTDLCAQGPSFWCRSRDAAKMCDATQHCQRFVWKDTSPDVGEHP